MVLGIFREIFRSTVYTVRTSWGVPGESFPSPSFALESLELYFQR